MKYLLNSAVLTTFGTWTYTPIHPDDARVWFGSHALREPEGACHCGYHPPQSTIGYAETANALALLLGISAAEVPVNRVQIRMDVGDEALVFRLGLPPGSPRIDPHDKGQMMSHITRGHWELGLLVRQA